MSRKFFLILCLLVLFSCLPSARLNLVEVKAQGSDTVHNLNTNLNYTTIQEAIDANETLDGHVIFVEAGIYHEHVVVNKSLSLIGENSSNTFIDGGGMGKVVTITANNTRISGFNIRGAGFTPEGSDSGIYLRSSNNIVFNNTITGNDDWGIWLDSSSGDNTITRNSITDNRMGCLLYNTQGNNLVGNNITNHVQDGIDLWDTFNNTIANNIISDNALGIGFDSSYRNNMTGNNITSNFYGITLLSSFNNTLRSNVLDNNFHSLEVSMFLYLGNQLSYFIQDIDASNTINGKPVCYWVNRNNEQVALDAGYVALVNCTNIIVKDLNLKNNFQGMVLACTNNSRIQNLNVTNNDHGIYLYRSCYNIICDSDLSNNQVGISLESSFENNIVYNNVTKAAEGIFLSDSSNNNVTNNNIENNKYRGVFVGGIENNIAYNNVTGNEMAGIGIYSDGKGTLEKNLVQGNNLINNTCGVQLGDTSGNKCYHNNFVNNTEQASVQVSIGSVSYGNIWDNGYPSGGNYWSNYTGIDLYSGPYQNVTGGDGIGDRPHTINSNNTDHYPLMGALNQFSTLYGQEISIVSNSSVSNFNFELVNSTTASLTFNVTGNTGTQGFCQLCIPKALINGSLTIMLDGKLVEDPQFRILPASNENYTYIYINYTHSEHTIEITGTTTISEFSSFLILPLMIATLLVVIVYKKKGMKTRQD